MREFSKLLLAMVISITIASCASKSSNEDLSLDASPSESLVDSGDGATTLDDEFEDFDGQADTEAAPEVAEDFEEPPAEKPAQQTAEASEPAGGDDFNLEEEPAQNIQAQTENTPPPAVEEIPEPAVSEDIGNQAEVSEPSAPQEVVAAEEEAPTTAEPVAQITGLNYKANENGGSVIIDATSPVNYTTRFNQDLNQFVLEVENAKLPDRLKRTLNTKDIKGAIGAVDAYQNPGSNTARIVVQLRQGAEEPVVQLAGNSIVLVAGTVSEAVAEGSGAAATGQTADAGPTDVLPVSKLEEYLVGNTTFYGKKISIEMNNMDIRDALQFVMDESGMNMVISDKVDGKVSLKLRQVPWDQALVIIMKAKSLGYTRQGNVLRIATMDELKKEEEDALKLQAERQKMEPLKVRMFPVSYANVADLEKKLKDFMSERGKVVADPRTSAVVVTETEDNLVRVAKLIESLDIRPPQVLIEGKIVEAKESFTRAVGVRWDAGGSDIKLGQTRRGPVNMRPSIGINQSLSTAGNNLGLDLAIGTLDIFGNLNAALSLRETEEQVKVISSPRAMVLTNETAIISQTQEVPVRQVTQNGATTQETFQFKPLSLKMEVTPQVTSEGAIIMKVAVARQVRGADVGSGASATFSVDSREANTRVLVQNGQTAVIGGIYNSEMTMGQEGVPWLRDLPFVGGLFRSNTNSRSKTELLVFITPSIVGNADTQTGPVRNL